ncbi:MAG: C25 family cysteine peptidase, partial [Holophagales bacterium]|nr:C25 family cysteine peptidase [Holophagales bacterium]
LSFGLDARLEVGQSYTWWDAEASPRPGSADPVYWLVEVGLDGERQWHGPAVPQPAAPSEEVRGTTRASSKTIHELSARKSGCFRGRVGRIGAWPAPEPSAAQLAVQRQLAAGPAVKIAIAEEGLYSIDAATLAAAGLDPSLAAAGLRLFSRGEEQPLNVLETSAGIGDGGAFADAGFAGIELYGFGADTPWTGERVYWLVAERGSGPEIPFGGRMRRGRHPAESFPLTVELHHRWVFASSVQNGDAENFWAAVVSEAPTELCLELDGIAEEPTSDAALQLAIQGFGNGVHDVLVEVGSAENGFEAVGSLVFEDRDIGLGLFHLSHQLLREGENILRLTARGGGDDVSLLDWARLTYRRSYTARDGVLRFAASGHEAVRVEGFGQPEIHLLDVTDPDAITRQWAVARPEGDLWTLELPRSASGLRHYLATAESRLPDPVAVEANGPSAWWAEAEPHDFLIVGPAELLAAAEPLALRREAQGWRVGRVDIDDVFDELGFSQPSPHALRAFLADLSGRWGNAPHVLLLGQASVDPRDWRGTGKRNLVPTKTLSTGITEAPSDEWLGDFDGDGVSELPLGRLPVADAEETAAAVAKLLAYEDAPVEPWMGRALIVAGHDDDPELRFGVAARSMEQVFPAEIETTLLDAGEMSIGDLRQTLLDRLGEGQLIVDYLGHGSVEFWGLSSGGSFLGVDDVATLANGPRLPLVVAMNCYNGFFDSIFQESLAAEWVLAPEGGAIAMWASSGATDSEVQLSLDQVFASHLLHADPAPTLGEAVRHAKRLVGDAAVRQTWILFGDPTLRLRRGK